MGFFAPAGTPAPVVEKLAAEIKRGLSDPELDAMIATFGFETLGTTGEAKLRQAMRAGATRWADVIKCSKVTLQ
jgi:tripartite-type tricarboxylate transporter receptor subunit TctC